MNNMTFRDLCNLVPTWKDKKLPTKKSLLSRGKEEILLEEIIHPDTKITVYTDGLILYYRGKYATVFSVDQCIGMPCNQIDSTFHDMDFLSLKPDEYMDLPSGWKWPIIVMCERRLDANQEMREMNHSSFSLDNNGNDWIGDSNDASGLSYYYQKYQENLLLEEDIELKHTVLSQINSALTLLTSRQRQVFLLHISHEKMTERKIADLISIKEGKHISHQCIHKILMAAIKKLRKYYE